MSWWWALVLAAGEAVAFLAIGRVLYRRLFARLVREADAQARRRFALERLGATVGWQIQICAAAESVHVRSPAGIDYFGQFCPFSLATNDWVRSDGVEILWEERRVVERAVKAWQRANAMYRERRA